MVVPWDGFPLAKLVALCEPKQGGQISSVHHVLRSSGCSGDVLIIET